MSCRPALRWPANRLIQPPIPPRCYCCAQARQELRELSGQDEGRKLDDILGSVGLAGVADQLKDLRLGESCHCCWRVLLHCCFYCRHCRCRCRAAAHATAMR